MTDCEGMLYAGMHAFFQTHKCSDVCKALGLKEGMAESPAACNTERDALHVGDRVVLHSLQSNPEHNGKSGTLVSFIARSGRWQVHLTMGCSLSVKATNLTKL